MSCGRKRPAIQLHHSRHPQAARRDRPTILLVEQKLPFARRVASEFLILEKGRCVAGGAIDRLSDDLVHQHLSV
jgi:ABC-type branched-subunit amino acid transport system ATPase component